MHGAQQQQNSQHQLRVGLLPLPQPKRRQEHPLPHHHKLHPPPDTRRPHPRHLDQLQLPKRVAQTPLGKQKLGHRQRLHQPRQHLVLGGLAPLDKELLQPGQLLGRQAPAHERQGVHRPRPVTPLFAAELAGEEGARRWEALLKEVRAGVVPTK